MSDSKQGTRGVIKVRLLRGGKVVRSYRLRSDTLTIGSGQGCTIRAAGDTSLAPRHATIYIEEGELNLVPEQDALVLLNGEPVDFAVPGPDDIIKAGRLTFRVELAESIESLAPPPASPKVPVPVPSRAPKTTKPPAPLQPPMPTKPSAPLEPPVQTKQPAMARPVVQAKPVVRAEPPGPEEPALSEDLLAEGLSRLFSGAEASPPEEAKEPQKAARGTRPIDGDEPDLELDLPRALGTVKHPPTEEGPDSTILGQPTVKKQPDIEGEVAYYDEDDDDELAFVEPFDLAEMLLQTKEAAREGPKEAYCAAHVIRIAKGRVTETSGVLPGQAYETGTGELACRIEGDRLSVKSKPGMQFEIWKAGERVDPLAEPLKDGMLGSSLGEGETAILRGEGGTYKIEVYRPPLPPKEAGFRADRKFLAIMVLAFAIHAAVGVAVAYVQPKMAKTDEQAAEEIFAVVKVEEQQEQKKQEEFQVEELPPPDAKDIAEKAPPKVSARTIRKRIKDREKSRTSSSVSSLLQVLSRGSGKAGASNKLKDLVSNIDAVAAKGGGSSFSIAGAIASLPGAGVNIARKGGGGAISTLSGDDVAGKGTGVGKLGKGKGGGKVRGKVTKMSSGARVQGKLSRAEVTRVINSHIHAIQACYERALMGKPNLSGRIVFDWVVTSKGQVTGVRVRSSTLGSTQVANCISKLIKRWKFPRPQGGEVTITYPFLFRSVSS